MEAVIADIKKQSPDAVYHLGDLVANGARPAEVFDIIKAAGWQGVYGNTDEMLWRPGKVDDGAERPLLRQILTTETAPVTSPLV